MLCDWQGTPVDIMEVLGAHKQALITSSAFLRDYALKGMQHRLSDCKVQGLSPTIALAITFSPEKQLVVAALLCSR